MSTNVDDNYQVRPWVTNSEGYICQHCQRWIPGGTYHFCMSDHLTMDNPEVIELLRRIAIAVEKLANK